MQRWDQYFLEGLGRGVQMAERSVDREREDTYRNKVLEDTKTTRDEDRKTRAAEREADRKEAEKRLEAEKVLREREIALRIRQLDEAKTRAEKDDARAAELERTRTRMSTFDRHFKAGTEMSPEDVAAEIEDLQGRDELDDDGQVRLDALRRAYSVQRSVMRNIRGKRVSIDPNDPLTRTEEPTLSQGVDLPEVGAVTREGVANALKEGMGRLRRPGAPPAATPAAATGSRGLLDILPGVDPDGVSSRLNALIQEKQNELDQHNREIAAGDERHGFLNMWSRRVSAAEADAKIRKAKEDKAALDMIRADPTHARAREVLERLNRDY